MSLLRADKIANRFNNTGPIIVGPSTVSGSFSITGITTVLGLGVTQSILVGQAVTTNYLTVNNGADIFNANLTGITTAGIVTGATYYGNGVNLTGVVTSVTAGAGVQISPVSGQGRVTISATGVAVAGYATNAGLATDVKGGVAGAVLYQIGPDDTGFTAAGSAGEILQSNGTGTPTWVSLAAINVSYADSAGISTNLKGGSAGRIPVQSGIDQTTFMPVGVSGNILLAQGTSTPIFIDPKAQLDVRRARFAGIATNLQSGYISSATSLEVIGVTTLGVATAKTLDVTGITTTDLLNVGTAGTIPNLTLSNSGIAVTAILDEDDMVSNRADALATQQSIRAYVDATRTGIGLTFDADTGTGTIDLDEETFTIEGTANEIYTIGLGNTVTVGLDTNVTVPNNLVVSGFSSLSGLTTITGSLGVTGITTTQNLEVIGVSTIGTLGVTGVTTTQFLEVTGVTTTGTLGVSGVTTSQFLEVTGVSTFQGDVTLGAGVTLFNGDFENSNLTGVTTVQNLGVTGITTTHALEVTGVSTLTGYVTAGTGLTVAGTGITATTLNVTGFSTQTGFATFGNSVNVANQFYAGGISSVGAAITMYPSTGIVSATAFYGDGSNLTGVVGLVSVTNILFVTPDGNDDNDGYLVSTAKRTVGSALTVAEASTVIKISAGNYTENNPIVLPEQVTLLGDSLREVSLIPQNADQDMIYVANGSYVENISFTGSLDEGKAIIAFNPDKPSYVTQGPYIRNCTNFISNSIGMKIDGKHVIGATKAMNVDSYTQLNQGGIGVSISNDGYAQLVSIFTIYNDQSIVCINGGQCDLTNSNSSFGRLGLVADGIGSRQFLGTVTTATDANTQTFTLNVGVGTLGITTADYTASTGIITITTDANHGFNEGQPVEIRDLEFQCSSGPGIVTFPSGNYGYVFTVDAVGAANSFSAYVGVSTLAHDYVRAGVTSTFVTRPYDGQVAYVDELYNSIEGVTITNGGSGYTTPPVVTFSSPSETWGITATGTAVLTNGAVTSIQMISNGRGYTGTPTVTIDGAATGTCDILPTYYVVSSSTPIVGGISTVTFTERVPYAVGVGSTVPFFKQSRVLASSHAFEYIGSGNTALTALPQRGGVAITENEVISQNGGLVIYTSTDQAGNFKIGDGVIINQLEGSITGDAYQRSLFANITPYILALGGDS
jgi:hypothetical protein